MDGQTLKSIRDHLLARRRQLSSEKETILDGVIPEPQAELVDIAQSLEQIDRDHSLLEQGRRELFAIDRALGKIAVGTFGICEDCDEEIPPRRLMVVPQARLCARCQEFEERKPNRGRGGAAGAMAR